MKVCSSVKYFLFLYTCVTANTVDNDNKKPNILVIFADDVGTGDVPGYWDTGKVSMPNLKKLVAEGTTFTDAHSTPLCSPSRYMFLSGNYQHRGERYPSVWNLNYKTGQFKKGQKSLAKLLSENGYDTAVFGKWHLGGKVPTKDDFKTKKFYARKNTLISAKGHDWTKPMEEGPEDIGFETSFITTGGLQSPPYAFFRNGTLDTPLDQFRHWAEGNYSMPNGLSQIKSSGEGDVTWDSSSYNMILVNETKAFLDKYTDSSSNPFFMYMALGAVHLPHSPPDKFLDGTPIAGQYQTSHMDMLFEMDKVVGAMIQALRDRLLLEDTIIIFTSDNGGLSSETTNDAQFGHYSAGPLKGHKATVYEGGIRVPLTFRWDNGKIPKGETRSNLIGLNDLYRTICGLIGISIPDNQAVDSMNFANYILDGAKTAGLRKWIGAWFYDQSRLLYEAIRYKEMKLIKSFQNNTYELYNLTSDIKESRDISVGNFPMIHFMHKKLRSISPCYDKYGLFKVKLPENIGGGYRMKSCYWFRKKRSKKRCNKFPEAKQICRGTCGGSNAQYCAQDLYRPSKVFQIFDNTY